MVSVIAWKSVTCGMNNVIVLYICCEFELENLLNLSI